MCYFDYNRAHGFYKVKKYGNNGKRALHKHSTDPDHLKHFNVEELSYMLPGMKIYLCPIILIQPYSQPNLIFHLCTLVSIFHMYMYVRNFLVLTLAHRFLGTGTAPASLPDVVVEFQLHRDIICPAGKDSNAPVYAVGDKRC